VDINRNYQCMLNEEAICKKMNPDNIEDNSQSPNDGPLFACIIDANLSNDNLPANLKEAVTRLEGEYW
jgi:hypothetical protein